jgi:putative transposase
MRAAGISGVLPRKRRRTTIRLPGLRVPPDLIERDFRPDEPNLTWSADITYISTWEGFLYLAHVQDLFSRLIVGWSMADHLRAELVVDALEMALYRRRPAPGLIHHSDQGCQYTAVLFTKRCAKAGIEISMGSVGDCYDNAVCETFHASIKKERIYRRSWPTGAEARTAVFEYIEGWYNPRRRHSTLGYLSRTEFERHHATLTTGRLSTASVTTGDDGSVPSEIALDVPTNLAQAATNRGQGTNGTRWPLRPVVEEQAR